MCLLGEVVIAILSTYATFFVMSTALIFRSKMSRMHIIWHLRSCWRWMILNHIQMDVTEYIILKMISGLLVIVLFCCAVLTCRTNYLEMIYLFAKRKNKNVRQIKLPYFLIALAGILATLLYWMLYILRFVILLVLSVNSRARMQPEYKFSYWHVKILSGYECVNNSKSISELGYVQRVSTRDGLRETWEWIDTLDIK
jgi:hypothetical protein